MSGHPVYIDSFSALLPDGLHAPGGIEPWLPGQNAIDGVQRSQVLTKPYLNFGKLTLSDRLAFAAACLLFRGDPLVNGLRTGIAIGAPWGSLSTDLRYMESVVAGFPSPAIFSSTLPSSAVAEIAIYFGCKGPNRTVSEGHWSGLAALELGVRAIENGKADAMVVISLSAIEPHDRSSPLLGDPQAASNATYAFLLTNENKPGGIGARFALNAAPAEYAEEAQPSDVYLRSLVAVLQRRGSGAIPVAAPGRRVRMCVGDARE